MAIVSFPTGFYLDRSTALDHDTGVQTDIMSDRSPRQRQISSTKYSNIACSFSGLTSDEKDTLTAFIKSNAANSITWVIDGLAYIGYIRGRYQVSMTGRRFNVSFIYYATELF